MFDPPSLISLTHSLLLHLQGATWIVQDHSPVWLCRGRPKVLPDLSSHLLCGAMATCRAGRGKRDSASPHLFLQSAGSFCLLKLFPVPRTSSQVMMINSVSLTHTERKYTLLYITSMCWTSFIPVGHVLYSSEPSTEVFCRMHPKILCCPHWNHSQNIVCHWQHSGHGTKTAVSSSVFNGWKNITLCTVVQARSLWKASEQDESQTTEIR